MMESNDVPTLDEDVSRALASEDSVVRIPPEKIAEMRAEVRRRLDAKRRRRRPVSPYPPPRYDEVYFEGVRAIFGEEPVE